MRFHSRPRNIEHLQATEVEVNHNWGLVFGWRGVKGGKRGVKRGCYRSILFFLRPTKPFRLGSVAKRRIYRKPDKLYFMTDRVVCVVSHPPPRIKKKQKKKKKNLLLKLGGKFFFFFVRIRNEKVRMVGSRREPPLPPPLCPRKEIGWGKTNPSKSFRLWKILNIGYHFQS